MVRQGHPLAVVGIFLISIVVVGCGVGGTGNNDGRGGKRGAAATKEETTAPEGDRSKTQTVHEAVGLDAKVVSPLGQANLPAGFGEGSLWATDFESIPPACDDVEGPGEGPCSASASASPGASAGAGSAGGLSKTLLRRLDPQTGEEVAMITLKGLNDAFLQVAFGAGSVWVSSGYYSMGPAPKRQPGDVVFRIDPRTNRVVDRIPVDPPSGLAFGHGSVWATSAGYGTVSRIDPQTGEVVAKIKVGRGAGDIAADESSGAVWIASAHLPKDYGGYDNPKYSEDRNLTRVDPTTNRVVEEIPIEAHSHYGGANNVAVGEGAVWVLSGDGNLLKVDPATNKVVGVVPLGEYSSDLEVYGGAVWATVQASSGTRLVRVDPGTVHVVASEHGREPANGGYGPLAAGGGYVWLTSGGGLARVAP